MRSTLRRNAMTTPASVHCMSRQLVFGDLSCTGFRRKIWHPRHHCLVTIHIISHWIMCSSWNFWISCSSWNFWIWILRSYRFGPGRQPPDSESPSILFSIGLCRCCTRCFLCTQLCNLGTENLSTSSGSLRQSSSQHSNLCGTKKTFVTIQHSDTARRRVLSNRQQWFTNRRLNTSNSEIGSPIIATHNMHSLATFDKFSSCCAESEITVTRNRSNLDPFRPSHPLRLLLLKCVNVEIAHVEFIDFDFWFNN